MNDSKWVAPSVLLAEHRALLAVVHHIQSLLRRVREGKASIDYGLMWSMVHYIDAFPDQPHHPKEDDWLFRRLRLRTSAADTIVSRLQAEHQAGPIALGEVRRQLGNAEAGVTGSMDCLQARIDGYAERTRAHLRAEETEVFPLAEQCLSLEDWDAIAEAFLANQDPLANAQVQRLDAMFRSIVSRTPVPLGLGSA